jgi:multidrug efflux pump subunit AcrA (membrane-fusion protein)
MIPVGLFVQAEIRGSAVDRVVRLPRSTVRDSNQVLVVDEDNRLRFRQVSILRLEHDEVLVSDGLADGELVCISPLQTVVDGMLVQPVVE